LLQSIIAKQADGTLDDNIFKKEAFLMVAPSPKKEMP